MTDNEIIKLGDICAYFYDNKNTSFSIVEVVEELSDECVVVKFHQVLRDDSGNGLFTYLCDKGKTMNVSRKYLHKVDLINRQKAEIERLKCSAIRNGKQIGSLIHHLETAKSEAYREFADKLHDNFISKVQKHYCRLNTEHSYKYTEGYTADDVLSTIVNTLEELTRNSHGTCTESNE